MFSYRAAFTTPAVAIAVATLSAAAAAQPPGPLASKRGDLNGDGKTDEVRVTRSGTVEVLIAGSAKSHITPLATISGARSARLEIDQTTRAGRVLAVAKKGDVREAVFLKVEGKRVTRLWSGLLPAADEDSGTLEQLEIIGGVLRRYHMNPAVTRCDGKQARLWHKRLLANGRFADDPPPLEITTSAQITAIDTAPSVLASSALAPFFEPRSVSSSPGLSPDLLTPPSTLRDRDPKTSWVARNRPAGGRGEFVTFRSSDTKNVRMIRVITGAGASPVEHEKNMRPRRVGVVSDSGDKFWAQLLDMPIGQPQWIVFPSPVKSRCISIVFDSVYSSRKTPRGSGVAISEVAILTEQDLDGGLADSLVDKVVRGGAGATQARQQLSGLGASGAAAVKKRLGRGDLKGPAALSLQRILAALGTAPEELAKGLGQRAASKRDRAELIAALVRIGDPALPALSQLVLDGRAAPKGRFAAARTIGKIGTTKARQSLFELTSSLEGKRVHRLVRAIVSKTLGGQGQAAIGGLTAALSTATGPARADLIAALAIAARDPKAVAELDLAVDALAVGLTASYEEQYRSLVGLGKLNHSSAAEKVGARIAALASSQTAQDVALRRVATRALAENSVASAAPFLLAAAGDLDPGVREAAVSALALRIGDTASDAPLAGLLSADAWPDIRRGAAGALAARCSRESPRLALRTAIDTENDLRVGQVVLTSVVRCGGGGVAQLFSKLALDRKRPTTLRGHAVSLLGQVNESGVYERLVALFKKFVRDSFTDAASIELSQAAAGGLCTLGDPRAVKPLTDAAFNSSYAETKSAAARALGCFCLPETRAPLSRLSRDGSPQVAAAAKRALRTCRAKRKR